MIHPGRFLALVLLASVTSLGLIYHCFGFSSSPPVLVPGVEDEVGQQLKTDRRADDEPTILEPTENAGFATVDRDSKRPLPMDDAYPDIDGETVEPPRAVIPLDSPILESDAESADLRRSSFEFVE